MVFVAVKAALFIISSLHTGLLVYTIAFRARLLLCVFDRLSKARMTSGTGKVGRTVVGEALRTTHVARIGLGVRTPRDACASPAARS